MTDAQIENERNETQAMIDHYMKLYGSIPLWLQTMIDAEKIVFKRLQATNYKNRQQQATA